MKRLTHWGPTQRYGFSAILLTLAACLVWLGWQWTDSLPAGLAAEYVGRDSCIQCHAVQHEQWRGSHHDLAMDEATPATVLGDFNNSEFQLNDITSRFFTKDGDYFVHTQGRDGAMETFRLKYTFGVDPLQQYLAEFPNGRLQALPIAWDVRGKRWFHLYAKENVQPHEWLYWTNRGMNWNYMCAECHSTNLQKNYDPKQDTYHTTWTDIDVSCEACHGPGSLHLQIVGRNKLFGDRRYGTGLAPLKSKNSQIQLDACGRCHARRQIVQPGFEPGEWFLDHYNPELLDTEAYYADGQIREEDYEYGSFHLSLMHEKGVRCTDCHDPHTSRLIAEGNQLCIRCHVAGKYDTPTHHFHKAGTKGSLCVDCHMPETKYMTVDPRRDHGFRIPRPDLTESLKIPNACNRCHDDKSAEWAQASVTKWYGEKEWPRRLNFAPTIHAARDQKPEAEKGLLQLARDEYLNPSVRASALALLRGYGSEKSVAARTRALTDLHPLVRSAAIRAFDPGSLSLPTPLDDPSEETPTSRSASGWWSDLFGGRGAGNASSAAQPLSDRIAESLTDPNVAVRFEAARILAESPTTSIPSEKKEAFQAALAGYIASMEYQSDDPAPCFNLANLFTAQGNTSKAEQYYRRALARDPAFNVARFNLAMLYYDIDRRKEAKETFEQALQWAEKDVSLPDSSVARASRSMMAQAYYSLGLLSAEESPDDLAPAVANFEKAVTLEPDRDRAHYNLGLAYQSLNELDKAERALGAAYRLQPGQPDYAYALAVFYAKRNDPKRAKDLLRQLLARHPDHADAVLLLQQLNRSSP